MVLRRALWCLVVLLPAGCASAAASDKPYAGQFVEVAGSWTGDEQANFLKSRARIDQAFDAFARGQFTLAVLAFDLVRAAAILQTALQFAEVLNESLQMSAVRIR